MKIKLPSGKGLRCSIPSRVLPIRGGNWGTDIASWKRLPARFPHLTPVRRSAPQIFFELFMSKNKSNPQRLFWPLPVSSSGSNPSIFYNAIPPRSAHCSSSMQKAVGSTSCPMPSGSSPNTSCARWDSGICSTVSLSPLTRGAASRIPLFFRSCLTATD